MSFTQGAPPPQGSGLGGFAGQILTTLQNGVLAINNLATSLLAIWPRTTGTFTMPAAATLTVTQPAIRSTSVIMLSPTNAAAATLMGSAKALYVSAIVPGASFTVATGNATNAAGTETLAYSVFNPS